MSRDSLKEEARKHEQKEDWAKALDLYMQAIDAQTEGEEPDIALHNRVADLQVRIGDLDGAVASYETAIDLYLEAELPNNAIAICRKIVRNDPKRPNPYLKMGQIRASQGFVVDARQNFLTYAEMLQGRGKTDEALKALEEFVGLVRDDVETRVFLAEQLVARERMDEAVKFLAQAVRTLMRQGDNDTAQQIAGRIEEIAPGHPIPMEEPEAEPVGVDDGGLAGFETTAMEPEVEPVAVPSGADEGDEGEEDEGGAEEDFGFSDFASGEAGDEEEADEGDEAPVATVDADEGFSDFGALEEPEAGGDEEAPVAVEDEGFGDLSFDAASEEEEEEQVGGDLPLMSFDEEEGVSDEEEAEAPAEELPTLDLSEHLEEAMEDAATADDVDLGVEVPDLESASPELQAALTPDVDAGAAVAEEESDIEAIRDRLRGEPENLELRRRFVEVAYETNDRAMLVEAFLELADALASTGNDLKAEAVYRQVLGLEPGNERAVEGLEKLPGATPAAGAPAGATAKEGDSDYVDLGSMVLDQGEESTTRWVVAAGAPSGDEQADFSKMLSQFKEKVSQNLSQEDARSHYDLGAAYKEMGLVDEAIEEFQRALRAEPSSLATFEMLGQCFLDKGEPEAAVRTLERALKLPTQVEDELLGIYYFLGLSREAMGESDAAMEFYEKIFSLDINFKDVTERLRSLR